MVRNQVRSRSRGVCEAVTPVCTGRAEHQHHKKGRGPHLNTAALILDCCNACHSYIHSHPAEAYERGWMIRRND